MGSLEQMPTGEMSRPIETKIPPEVLEMDSNLISEAKDAFGENHKLVVEAMGLGPRKSEKILAALSECQTEIKDLIRKARNEKEKIYS